MCKKGYHTPDINLQYTCCDCLPKDFKKEELPHLSEKILQKVSPEISFWN